MTKAFVPSVALNDNTVKAVGAVTAVATAFSPWTQFKGQWPSLQLMATLTAGSHTHHLCTLVDCADSESYCATESANLLLYGSRSSRVNVALAFYWQHRRTSSVVTTKWCNTVSPCPWRRYLLHLQLPGTSLWGPHEVFGLWGNLTGVNATDSDKDICALIAVDRF